MYSLELFYKIAYLVLHWQCKHAYSVLWVALKCNSPKVMTIMQGTDFL
jgi:hypothetical protein